MVKVPTFLAVLMLIQYTEEALQFSLTKISCDFNKEVITNSSCGLKPLTRRKKLLKLQFTVFKPLETIKVRIRNLKKTNANRFMPGFFDITRDMCEFMAGDMSHNFLVHFVEAVDKGTIGILKPYFRPCPYAGFVSYEAEMGDSETPIKIMETGEYQTDITLFSNDSVRYLNLKTFFKVNCR